MRTLTEVFAPGAPSLPEGLRTLVVSPDRSVEPGTTVRVVFAFYNFGGAAATGLRVRFNLPEGLRYIPGSARVDDRPLDDQRGETALLAPNGGDVGEVPPGVERRISLAFAVAATIENGAVIELQAALASNETDVIGSNVVRLVAVSAPQLQNPETVASLEAIRVAEPGEQIHVAARIHNSGHATAHDVVVVLPVPDRTTYVEGSALVDGREMVLDERGGDPFGFGSATVVAASLAPGATLVVEYRARIDSPLDDNTRIVLSGAVAATEIAEFELDRAELTVRSASRFDTEATRLVVDAPNEVEPGRRVRVAMIAENAGTCAAEEVRIRLTLPEGLRYAPGSRAVDGRSVSESESPGVFHFTRVDAGARVEAAIDAYVVSPAVDGTPLPIASSLRWGTGSRAFERTLTVRSSPRFLESRNVLVLEGPSQVTPGGEVCARVRIANDGTAQATGVRVVVEADPALQLLRYADEGGEARVQPAGIDIGTLGPGAGRTLTLSGTVASPIADRFAIRVRARIESDQTPALALGQIELVVRSRPRFAPSTSALTYPAGEPLRPSGHGDVAIVIVNEGTDTARDTRLQLDLTPEARIEAVDGATRVGTALLFGDVLPGMRAEATVRVRLARLVPRGTAITINGRLEAVGLLPLALAPVTIATVAEARFDQHAALRTQPAETVDAGEALYVRLVVRNTGDGAASRLVIRGALPEHTAYFPGSTAVNDVPLLDVDGGSVLWSKAGLLLEDVDPGVEVAVRYCAIVNTPLAAGTLIDAHVDLAWDGGSGLALSSPAVRVRSTPAFAVRASGLPFSVSGIAPRTADVLNDVAEQRRIAQAPVAALPPPAAEPPAPPQAPPLPPAAPTLQATIAPAAPPPHVPPTFVPPAPETRTAETARHHEIHRVPDTQRIYEAPPQRHAPSPVASTAAPPAPPPSQSQTAAPLAPEAPSLEAPVSGSATAAPAATPAPGFTRSELPPPWTRLAPEPLGGLSASDTAVPDVEQPAALETDTAILDVVEATLDAQTGTLEILEIEAAVAETAVDVPSAEPAATAPATAAEADVSEAPPARAAFRYHEEAIEASFTPAPPEEAPPGVPSESAPPPEAIRSADAEAALSAALEASPPATEPAAPLFGSLEPSPEQRAGAEAPTEALPVVEAPPPAEPEVSELQRLVESLTTGFAPAAEPKPPQPAPEPAPQPAASEPVAPAPEPPAPAAATAAPAPFAAPADLEPLAEDETLAEPLAEAGELAGTMAEPSAAVPEASVAVTESSAEPAAEAASEIDTETVAALTVDVLATESRRDASEAEAVPEAALPETAPEAGLPETAAPEVAGIETPQEAPSVETGPEAAAEIAPEAAPEAAAETAPEAAAGIAPEAVAETAPAVASAELAPEAALPETAPEAAGMETARVPAAPEPRTVPESEAVTEEPEPAAEAAPAAPLPETVAGAPAAEPEMPIAEAAPAAAAASAPEPAAAIPEPPITQPAAAAEAPPAEPETFVAAAAPVRVRLVFQRDALERALMFLEQSDYGGLITHLFAIRTLMPTAFVGLNGDIPGKLVAQREALRGVVDRLFIKMRMPRYALTAKDVEDRASRAALVDLVASLRDASYADDLPIADGAVVLEGPLDIPRLTPQLGALESEPLGSARPWLVLAQMLPHAFVSPRGGDALTVYRSTLVATFTNVAALPNEEFHRVLGGTQHAALDAALRDVRAALRDALEASAAKP